MPQDVAEWDKNKRSYYHFTTLDSFRKIFATSKLRLTPCNSAKNVAVEIMALYSSVQNILDNNSDVRDQLLRDYSCRGDEDLIEYIIEQRVRSYIACFAMFDANNQEDEKSQILKASYMWKFYADNSNGVVIKFNYLCFPYKKHQTEAELNANRNYQRSSEIRIDHAIYDEDKLKNWLTMLSKDQVHLFGTDVYKPQFCAREKEIRFIVHLTSRKELYKLNGISESGTHGSELPEFLYYDFASSGKTNGPCIEKIFCKKQDTYSELCDVVDKNLVAHIGCI